MTRIWYWIVWIALAGASASPSYGQVPDPPAQDQPTGGQPSSGQPRPPGDFRDFDELDLNDLLNVTVSIASGKVQRAEEAPSIVSVVTDQDIRRMGARTLADVLRTVPGFEVLTNNLGQNRIAVRGVASQIPTTLSAVFQASSENILVLFNGHRLNEHFTGGATVVNLEIPLYNIKQVEIIRGPGSALFGANAFNAVINLVPYTARTLDGIEASAAGGSFDTQQYYMLAGHTAGALGISGSFQFSDTSGPRLLVPRDAQARDDLFLVRIGQPPLTRAPRTTSGGRRGVDFFVNASYKGFTANGRVRDEQGDGFIGFGDKFGNGTDRLDSRQILFDAAQSLALGRRAGLAAKVSFTQNEVRSFLTVPSTIGAAFDFSINSRRYATELVLDHRISESNQLTVGGGYENESTYDPKDTFQSQQPGQALRFFPLPDSLPVTARKISSVFAQEAWNPIPALGVTAGVRYDHYNDFGSTVNPRAGLVWRLPRRFHVKTLYGRAFRAPTLTELFVDLGNFSITRGNPGLKPSTINTLELALGYKDRSTRASVTYFNNAIRDYIIGPFTLGGFIVPPPQGVVPARFYNSPDFHVQGVELDLKRTFGFDHEVFANYAYQHGTYPSTTATVAPNLPTQALVDLFVARLGATPAIGLPSHMATLGFTAGMGTHLSVTPTVLLRGERPRQKRPDETRPPLPAHGIVNLNVRLKELFDRIEVAGTIGNLFDRRYVDPAPFLGVPGDYPKPGRNGLLKATWKF